MEVFGQVLILFSFVTLGYILSKTGKVKTEHSKILSSILVNVCLPFSVFKSFAERFTVEYLRENYLMVTVSVAVLLILSVVAFFGSRLFSKNKYIQRIYEYSLVVPNLAYMGYPLAEAMYGAAGLMDLMMFCIPIYFYIYIYGYSYLTKSKLSLKGLLKPNIMAMIVGMILGLSGIQMPGLTPDQP